MKIKGWEKLSGITYKGLTIVNPIHNADETKYTADIINFNKPDKPLWRLGVLTDNHRFRKSNSKDFFITIRGEGRTTTARIISKEMMMKLSMFRIVFEDLVDEMLAIEDRLFNAV